MQQTHAVCPTQTHVRAVFTSSVAYFDIPLAATLEQLADRLSLVGEHHHGPLTSIDVQAEPYGLGRLIPAIPPRRFADAGRVFSVMVRQ